MQQAGRSRVRIPMRSIDVFTNHSSRTMALGVYSDSNRNEYREYFWGRGLGEAGARSLQLHRHLWADVLEMEASTSHNPIDLRGLLRE
jgi:hypothetical protein